MGKLHLSIGQDLDGQENLGPNEKTTLGISMGYRQEDSG
jgi:hypothetical protein